VSSRAGVAAASAGVPEVSGAQNYLAGAAQMQQRRRQRCNSIKTEACLIAGD
jgi:hypothetical protein